MKKNIVVLSDGTGQEGGKKYNTNVYKLFNLAKDRSHDQVVFYDRGLGTGWRKLGGNIAGAGISKNILECYQFIFENYCAGDEIFLFGFSRGATTVRSLSGFIHLFGILPRSRPELIKRAYKIYQIKNKEKRRDQAANFLSKNHNMWAKIKFLGVWDTVSALGLPNRVLGSIVNRIPGLKHQFHDLTLSPCVENAYQALALDEERKVFSPVLWEKSTAEKQTMQQVWFSGVHTDVGGGYPTQRLSDIPLVWMLQKAKSVGFKIYAKHKVVIEQDADGLIHDSRAGAGRLYPKLARRWDSARNGQPWVHQSVLDRKLNKNNTPQPTYSSWILAQEYQIEEWNPQVPD